ncbi:ATPase domain-containing protein [Ideonella sp. BN130291]|uniref:ATPase domain-containing protein n=1 Tax=Ideonella sp. BN130291 TaxID=3112940 RepID=UPI002E274488|nr:ATPase domain-containing protein [Ideonella sp. BN130291]
MNTSKATIRRLRTGVPGLDAVLGGGLPEYSFNLIAGPPGCGKTTLAHQIVFSLATPATPALYFTILGEPPLKMLRYQQQFDFFDADKVNQCVRFVNLADDTASGDLDAVLARIEQEVRAVSPAVVVVDSFRSVALASHGEGGHARLQQFIQQLGMLMTSWQATTFLIGEYFTEKDPNPVFTVSDGLLWMFQSVQRNSVVRKVEVMKMRGQATLPGLHTFRITSGGIEVFAPARAEALAPLAPAVGAPAARVSTGIAALDDMLGGGLPQGYSLLVAGPSGSGKSILATSFLAEGARLGEHGVVASFEQGPRRSRDARLNRLVDEGAVSVIATAAPDLSIDEATALLLAQVRSRGARRVVVDSLSSFELALAPTFRDDFRESLAHMVSALASTGATVLLTSELEDRYSDLRFSPYGTAFLTDAIIVQRYVEIDSRLERVMGVVKLRGSAHSNELRLFQIDEHGIQLGERLAGHTGLLAGQPRRNGGPVAGGARSQA